MSNKGEEQIIDLLSRYTYKYMHKLLSYIKEENVSESKTRRLFQESLINVSVWNQDKITREFKKFLKWCYKKYDLQEPDMQSMVDNFIFHSIYVLLSNYDSIVLEQFDTKIKLELVFYKSIKRTARLCYENIVNTSKLTVSKENTIHDVIEPLLHSFVPLDKIISYIEEHQDEDKSHSYDFKNRTLTPTSTHLSVAKDNKMEPLNLHYISSEEIYDEYYESEEEKQPRALSNDKHIKIPKKPFFYGNKK